MGYTEKTANFISEPMAALKAPERAGGPDIEEQDCS